MKHKIYIFQTGMFEKNVTGMALGDDGAPLAGHTSSTLDWLKHDLGISSDWKKEEYDKHFGKDNWEVIWCNSIEAIPKEVIELRKQWKE